MNSIAARLVCFLVLGLLALTLADTTLRRPEDVEQALGLRLAGTIPHQPSEAGTA